MTGAAPRINIYPLCETVYFLFNIVLRVDNENLRFEDRHLDTLSVLTGKGHGEGICPKRFTFQMRGAFSNIGGSTYRDGTFERFKSANLCAAEAGKWEEAVQAYLACISFADSQIERIVAALDENGLTESTIVVFFSDNGFHLGEKGHWHKSALWERATHVPLAMMIPESVSPGLHGIECNHAVSLLDIYPTFVELCGLQVPEWDLDGESLTPTVRGERAERPVLINFLPGNFAVRSDTWRLIHYADGTEELYNCTADPGEHDNLVKDGGYSTVAAELRALVPKSNAEPVPIKDDYDFDLASYTWRPK